MPGVGMWVEAGMEKHVYDVKYGHPECLIYEGSYYKKVEIEDRALMEELLRNSVRVIPNIVQGNMKVTATDDAVQKEQTLVFNKMVYQWTPPDSALPVPSFHAIKAILQEPPNPQKGIRSYELDGTRYYQSNGPSSREMIPAYAGYPAHHAAPKTTAATAAEPIHTRPRQASSVRASTIRKSSSRKTGPLKYGFEMPLSQQIGFQPASLPSKKNQQAAGPAQGGRRQMQRYTQHQKGYLFCLVALGMFDRQRSLRWRDYKAVTDALNRAFTGDVQDDGTQWVEKGYETVQSTVLNAHGKRRLKQLKMGILGYDSDEE